MPTENEAFIKALARHLHSLPDVETRQERHESWMTAEQIANWWSGKQGDYWAPRRIDAMLRSWWLARPEARAIRPAKYPDRDTASRLWGHVERVGRLSNNELQLVRTDRPVEVEALSLTPEAPQYFLSYAAPNLHFAARVRLALGNYGVRCWMFSADIEEEQLVFEGVQAALSASQRVLALVTPFSLPSAWINTEIQTALGHNHDVALVFDGSHPVLMHLLASWHPPQSSEDPFYNGQALSILKAEYARHYPGVRVEKYDANARQFLYGLNYFDICVYPRRPSGWKGPSKVTDFEETFLGIRRR